MAWRSNYMERTREWARSRGTAVLGRAVPLWVRQSLACLFIFFLVFGASRAGTGASASLAAFAKDAVSKDLSYGEVKAWVQSLPSLLGRVSSLDLQSFWSKAVTGNPTDLMWPVSGQVSSYFGWRPDPNSSGMSLHQGIDIDAPKGTKVASVLSGVVAYVGESPEYGLTVEVQHGGGLSSVYAHLDTIAVKEGQKVNRGDALGTVGATGNATAPHLHFELRKDGLEVDPMTVLPPLVKGP